MGITTFCKCGHSRENHSVRGGFPLCEGTTIAACDCKLYEPEPTAKHTPGPWEIEPYKDWDKEITVSANGDGWHRLGCMVDCDDCDTETAKANARLIAAAPKLLEALKAIVENGTVHELEDGEYAGLCVFSGNRVEFLKGLKEGQAAIAEAEGRQ